MTAFAMVVVVEADDAGAAFDVVAQAIPDVDTNALTVHRAAYLISEPWAVTPSNPGGEPVDDLDVEFDALDCVDQHPEKAREARRGDVRRDTGDCADFPRIRPVGQWTP